MTLTWTLVNKSYADARKAEGVRAFVGWGLRDGQHRRAGLLALADGLGIGGAVGLGGRAVKVGQRESRAAPAAVGSWRGRNALRTWIAQVTAADLPRRLVAEALGTGLLVATVVGSGIMAAKLAGGDQALALLCNTLPTGAILVVLITVLAPVSGAHLNPAVSAAMALRRDLPAGELPAYVLAQIIGGITGSWLAHAMFDLPLLQASITPRTGPGQWLGEITATFGLLLAIFGAVRFNPSAVSWCVGLYITAAYWFTSSTSFANPAVTIARALSDTFAGIRPADVPAFVLAQLAGALLASVLTGWLFAPRPPESA